jgi:hypothetical protein
MWLEFWSSRNCVFSFPSKKLIFVHLYFWLWNTNAVVAENPGPRHPPSHNTESTSIVRKSQEPEISHFEPVSHRARIGTDCFCDKLFHPVCYKLKNITIWVGIVSWAHMGGYSIPHHSRAAVIPIKGDGSVRGITCVNWRTDLNCWGTSDRSLGFLRERINAKEHMLVCHLHILTSAGYIWNVVFGVYIRRLRHFKL